MSKLHPGHTINRPVGARSLEYVWYYFDHLWCQFLKFHRTSSGSTGRVNLTRYIRERSLVNMHFSVTISSSEKPWLHTLDKNVINHFAGDQNWKRTCILSFVVTLKVRDIFFKFNPYFLNFLHWPQKLNLSLAQGSRA